MGYNVIERNVETRQVRNLGDITHTFMGAGKYDNKHGVGIMLNKKWRQRIIDTEHINERAITATIVVNPPQTDECVFHPLGISGPSHRKHVRNDREAHDKFQKIHICCWRRLQVVGGDFNAELGPGHGTECMSVGR